MTRLTLFQRTITARTSSSKREASTSIVRRDGATTDAAIRRGKGVLPFGLIIPADEFGRSKDARECSASAEESAKNNHPEMKRLLLTVVVTTAILGGLATPLSAAPWQSINQRQAILEARINEGFRKGVLTRPEAITLRGEFNTLARLEAQYRKSDGYFTERERADLDKRFNGLQARIRLERRDSQERPARWIPINERQAELDQRIDAGVRRGSLTRTEAIELRGEFRTLLNLEAEYRRSRGYFSQEERLDLDRRMDRLDGRISAERRDRQSRF